MNIYTALSKLKKLSIEELKHIIFLYDVEIENYKLCIVNYSEYKMKRFGIPYLNILKSRQQTVKDELENRTI